DSRTCRIEFGRAPNSLIVRTIRAGLWVIRVAEGASAQVVQNEQPEGGGQIGRAVAGGIDLGDEGGNRDAALARNAFYLGVESVFQRDAGPVAADCDRALAHDAHRSSAGSGPSSSVPCGPRLWAS